MGSFIVNGNYALSDKFGVSLTRVQHLDMKIMTDKVSLARIKEIHVFRHFNFSNQAPIQYSQVRNIVGAYGQAEFDYNKYLYLTVTRNDWV
jgi:hypothetical protein